MFSTATFDGLIGFCRDRCLNKHLSDGVYLPSEPLPASRHRAVPFASVLTYSHLSAAINLPPRSGFALNAGLGPNSLQLPVLPRLSRFFFLLHGGINLKALINQKEKCL